MTNNAIDKINGFIGKSVSWLSLALVLIIVVDVAMRYLFSITSSASFELEWHLFAALFMLSAGWAFGQDKHVRVDVFYQNFSPRQQATVNLIGCIFLLLPLAVVGTWQGVIFTANSFALGETSPDPGGLPARYLIKSTIPLGFALLGLQGLSEIFKSLQTLFSK
ncbi:TRAP transporter small permease subunit [Marinoscillum furvescens]|uniref:TRAP-type mannitol/chloroaromatic compound transport system permease small subunit n=1 Tax=Marinoscillum furvescens DSM 4134 TaxID=1122208 RepID=A0A3D9L7Q3_MARFU|nr:TRAP transporter small permease subunit [Marinoscillum furvescens]REE01515.1 TRAP-type mannitol/chloroaromatic compound transport system permease small subunit [Marinoscillum furvescens DSM 4134]